MTGEVVAVQGFAEVYKGPEVRCRVVRLAPAVRYSARVKVTHAALASASLPHCNRNHCKYTKTPGRSVLSP